MILAGFIELIAKIKQKNNGTFKLVDAQDVECEDGKGLDEVLNEKLDKNQGTENVGLTLVVGKDGNLELGESTPKDVYTKEEVDYMLADKMDKPYVPITITDNATITDALEGNFKIDKIKGNTYQNVENNIVPTPEGQIPIRSKKITVDGEIVELRSLKESVNVWDYNNVLGSEGDAIISNSWATSIYDVEDNIIKLKPNTKYTCQSIVEMVNSIDSSYTNYSYEKVLRLYRKPDNEYGLPTVNIIMTGTTDILNNGETKTNKRTFTTPKDLRGCEILGYTERWTKEGSPSVSATVKFKNIMLVEGDSAPSLYVPPTVRDYKIVDHTNETSKIVRNVGLYVDDKTGEGWNVYSNSAFPNSYMTSIKDMKKSNQILSFANAFEVVDENTGIGNVNSMWLGVKNSIAFAIKTDFATLEEWKTWLSNNDFNFLYPLATPTEESIPYFEDDTSEVGYSWQDTTSPSPTIKSEVKGVEEIDILKTGKNLLNETLAKDYTNYINLGNGYSKFVVNVKPNTKYTVSRKDDKGAKLNNYMYVQGTQTMWMIHTNSNNVNVKQVTLTSTENGTLEVTFAGINQTKLNEVWDILGYLQIELGETATAYEPYTGQHINIALPQPLYENDIANVESENYEYEMQKYVVTGDEVFIQDYQNRSGYYGRYFNLKNGMGLVTDKVFCNCLNYVRLVWNSESEGVCQNSNIQIHLKFSNDRLGITDNTPVEEKRTAFANYLKQLYASGDPLYVVVKVAKITETIPPEDLKLLKSLKTNAGVNNIFINGEVKPTIEAKYPRDVVLAVNKLQNKLLTLQEGVVKNV